MHCGGLAAGYDSEHGKLACAWCMVEVRHAGMCVYAASSGCDVCGCSRDITHWIEGLVFRGIGDMDDIANAINRYRMFRGIGEE